MGINSLEGTFILTDGRTVRFSMDRRQSEQGTPTTIDPEEWDNAFKAMNDVAETMKHHWDTKGDSHD